MNIWLFIVALIGSDPFPVQANDVRDVILSKALESIAGQFTPDEYRVTPTVRWMPGRLLELEVDDIQDVEPSGEIGPVTIFDVSAAGRNGYRTYQIQVMLKIERRVPVAAGRLTSGTQVRADDFVLKWVQIPRGNRETISSVEQLDGKVLRRNLAPGQPVRHPDIGSTYLVETGDPVRLIFREGGVEIELSVVAQQSGALKEKIRMFSDATGRRYTGEVVAPGVALWKETL